MGIDFSTGPNTHKYTHKTAGRQRQGSNKGGPMNLIKPKPVKAFRTLTGFFGLNSGGAEGDRTPDLMTASHALSQLSYSPRSLCDYLGFAVFISHSLTQLRHISRSPIWCQAFF